MRALPLLILLGTFNLFAQSEKVSLKLLDVEVSDKKFKKELGDAFSTFKKDGLEGKLMVDSAWKVEVVITENRQQRKNQLDLWIVKEVKKKPEPTELDKFYLIHRVDYSYETAFDMEMAAVGTHDPIFLKAMVHLKSGKAQGELTGKRVSRYENKESNDGKNIYTREIVTVYSLNDESGQLKIDQAKVDRSEFVNLFANYQQ